MQKSIALAALLALFAACDNGSGSGPVAPGSAGSTATPTVEMFNGTVDIGGTDVHPFTVAQANGTLNVTLTAAGPPSTIFMGLGVGSWVAPTCTPISGATGIWQAGTTAQISGTAGAGNFCVAVYDVGNQTAQISYSVTVSHF